MLEFYNYNCQILLASKSQWISRPQRKRHRSSTEEDDVDVADTIVKTKKDSNLEFVTAKDQYVSTLFSDILNRIIQLKSMYQRVSYSVSNLSMHAKILYTSSVCAYVLMCVCMRMCLRMC